MTETRRGHGFLTGLFGGALLGAAAGTFFAPQISAACQRFLGELTDAVTDAGDAAANTYHEATARAGSAVHDLQEEGRGAYGKVLSVVVRGADDVKERAAAVLSQSAADATRRSS
jgi:gas vesicle protein